MFSSTTPYNLLQGTANKEQFPSKSVSLPSRRNVISSHKRPGRIISPEEMLFPLEDLQIHLLDRII